MSNDLCGCGRESTHVAHVISNTEVQYWIDIPFCENCYSKQSYSVHREDELTRPRDAVQSEDEAMDCPSSHSMLG
jgi:hypothetical protein